MRHEKYSGRSLTTFRDFWTVVMTTGFALTLSLIPVSAQTPSLLSDQETTEVNKLIRNYLMENPAVLAQAIENMQDYYRSESKKMQSSVVNELAPQLVADPRDKSFGPLNAKNIIVEFFDYNCGYCKKNFPVLQNILADRNDIRFIYKELPILSESSILAAELALAIDDLKTYRQFHTILMEKKSKLNNREIRQAVQSVGLDYDTLKAKSDSTSIKNHIKQNNDLAQALGIQGTPSFFINGVIYEGALSRDEIQSKLNN